MVAKTPKPEQATKRKRGRPKGSRTKTPKIVRDARRFAQRFVAVKAMQEIPADKLFTGDAYDFFVCMYKDMRNDVEFRKDAAKSAIRHEKPQLQSSTVQHSGTLTLESLVMEAIEKPPCE